MKKIVLLFTFFVAVAIIFLSCKKPACENCDNNPVIGGVNKFPIAIAGPDKIITLPTDSVSLDGSASSDPDGNIISRVWSSIGGLVTTFEKTTGSRIVVDSLVRGVFLFELKVTDDRGYNSFDTVQVIVNGTDCIISGRPVIDPQLIEIGTLSEARDPVVAAVSNKVVFAGGYAFVCGPDWSNLSSAVDIFDVVTGSWTSSRLSVPREGMAAVSAGNKIFLAGGNDFHSAYDNVDIYDVVTNTWAGTWSAGMIDSAIPAGVNYSIVQLGQAIYLGGGHINNTYCDYSNKVFKLEF